jgi:8-amino-7-oxononanoate synthase
MSRSCRFPASLLSALDRRRADGSLRIISALTDGVDLCSNDYLGVARRLGSREELHRIIELLGGDVRIGATGSRLISGTTGAHEELEDFLASFHQCETATLFGSGYEANLGILSCVAGREDTIIFDELVHASMRDGIRLSVARSFSFRHNDLEDLRAKIRAARGVCYVAVESLYSMDGDCAPLLALCEVCEESGAFLIVDEAHATGVYGRRGEGLVQMQGLHDRVFARVHTFGKALGFRGGCVVGASELREYIANFARPFIYATAPDLFSLQCIRRGYSLVSEAAREREILVSLAKRFQGSASAAGLAALPSTSPIQAVIVPGNENVVRAEERVREAGFCVKAIRSPTVPAGLERLRVSLHAYNSPDEIGRFCEVVGTVVGGF